MRAVEPNKRKNITQATRPTSIDFDEIDLSILDEKDDFDAMNERDRIDAVLRSIEEAKRIMLGDTPTRPFIERDIIGSYIKAQRLRMAPIREYVPLHEITEEDKKAVDKLIANAKTRCKKCIKGKLFKKQCSKCGLKKASTIASMLHVKKER